MMQIWMTFKLLNQMETSLNLSMTLKMDSRILLCQILNRPTDITTTITGALTRTMKFWKTTNMMMSMTLRQMTTMTRTMIDM